MDDERKRREKWERGILPDEALDQKTNEKIRKRISFEKMKRRRKRKEDGMEESSLRYVCHWNMNIKSSFFRTHPISLPSVNPSSPTSHGQNVDVIYPDQ